MKPCIVIIKGANLIFYNLTSDNKREIAKKIYFYHTIQIFLLTLHYERSHL